MMFVQNYGSFSKILINNIKNVFCVRMHSITIMILCEAFCCLLECHRTSSLMTIETLTNTLNWFNLWETVSVEWVMTSYGFHVGQPAVGQRICHRCSKPQNRLSHCLLPRLGSCKCG